MILQMKKPHFLFLTAILLLASLLTSCAGGTGIASSWPGLTVDTEGETVYLAFQAHVYAINLTNGTEKWRFPAKADNKITFYASPVLTEDNQLIAGGYDRLLYSLNPNNGQQNWAFQGSGDHYITAPLVAGENIFAPSADNFLYTLNLAGSLRWKFRAEHALWSTPVMDEKYIYLPSMDHHLYALETDTGNLVWKSEDLGGALVGNPTFDPQGILYIGTFGSEMIALNASSGKVLWRTPTAGWVWSGPALEGETLYFGDLEGKFYALNAKDGTIRWQVQPDASENRAIAGKPLILGDTIYFASKAGILYAVDPVNGSPRWNKTVGGEIYANMVAAGDILLIAPVKADAILFAVDLNGNPKWSYTPAKEK